MSKEEKTFKVLLLQSKYVSEEYDSVQEQWGSYRTQFYKDFPEEYKIMLENQEKDKNDTMNTDIIKSEGDEEIDIDIEKKNTSKVSRTLYRRISKMTHPDKIESDFLNNYFKKASTAYSGDDLPTLINIASHLHINFSDLDLQEIPAKLSQDINEKNAQIINLRGSLAWKWATATTEEEKEVIKIVIKEKFHK